MDLRYLLIGFISCFLLKTASSLDEYCEVSEVDALPDELWNHEDKNSVELPPEQKITAKGVEINIDEGSKLEVIPEALIKYCPNLNSIYIVNSDGFDLEDLEKDLFELTFPKINYFTIGDCNAERKFVKTIGPYAFSRIPNIIEVEIIKNNVDSVASTAFRNNTKLKKISIVDNLLVNLDPTIFQGLKFLRVIKIAANKLETLPENIFNGLDNLQVTNFQQNELKILPEKIFQGLKNLTIVNFAKNRLEVLPEKLFHSSRKLQKVDFSYNSLKVVNENWFKSSPHLRDVNFSFNQLVVIETNAFKNLKNLEIADFHRNLLTTITEDLFDWKKVNKTDFSYNKINEIPDSLKNLQNFKFENQFSKEIYEHPKEWEGCPETDDEAWIISEDSGVIQTVQGTIAQVPKVCPDGKELDFLGRCRFVSER